MREISDLIAAPATEKQGEVLEDEDFSEDFCHVKPNSEPVLQKKTQIAPLAAVDHSKVLYGPLLKSGYKEHPAVSRMTQDQLSEFYKQHNISITGEESVKPVFDFHHLPIDISVIDKIAEQNIYSPTPIQSLSLPASFLGRDILAVSETASGKTLAFTLPLVYSVKTQGRSGKGEGPSGLVLVPTRELCLQVFKEVKKFAGMFKLKVVALYGGVPKNSQWKELRTGCEIVVATPARLIDLVQSKACSLKKVGFLVIDEADLMFNMGFEYQVRSIISQIRPDRQTLLFSATLRQKLSSFIEEFLTNPLKITIGSSLHCNPSVFQEIIVLDHPSKRLSWLLENLRAFLNSGLVLIFVKHRATTEELCEVLKEANIAACNLHGDMDQGAREAVVELFKKEEFKVLVGTDVASRGLNIVRIATVINYDCPKDVETHIHRIGRTGREGEGKSITLLTKHDKKFAGDLLLNLEYNDQDIPEKLEKLAMEDQAFRMQRMKNDRNRVRHCKTGDLQTANAIMAKIGSKKLDFDTTASADEFRQQIQGQQKDYFQEDFKQKFVKAGNLTNEISKTTVTYLEMPRKKSKWEKQD